MDRQACKMVRPGADIAGTVCMTDGTAPDTLSTAQDMERQECDIVSTALSTLSRVCDIGRQERNIVSTVCGI